MSQNKGKLKLGEHHPIININNSQTSNSVIRAQIENKTCSLICLVNTNVLLFISL